MYTKASAVFKKSIWEPIALPTIVQTALTGGSLSAVQYLGLKAVLPAMVAGASLWTLGGIFAAFHATRVAMESLDVYNMLTHLTNNYLPISREGLCFSAGITAASLVLSGGALRLTSVLAAIIINAVSEPLCILVGQELLSFLGEATTSLPKKIEDYAKFLFSKLPGEAAKGAVYGATAGLTLYTLKYLAVDSMIPAVITSASFGTLALAFVAYSAVNKAVSHLDNDQRRRGNYNAHLLAQKANKALSMLAAAGAASFVLTGSFSPPAMLAMVIFKSVQDKTTATFLPIEDWADWSEMQINALQNGLLSSISTLFTKLFASSEDSSAATDYDSQN